ncbi:1,4-alpha-glucan branching protein GlgB [Cucumibacter marinus]|uniref:1,4-alpha-glucan branching protein GlgB n=1 Tax=Cucumibacter marinus TaxID=1121252 RepID=UPI00041B1ABB|nr:1,4-alpha-glucan branching protein GlgB [Cucumibacter marinus]
MASNWRSADSEIIKVVSGEHNDPFAVLGLHEVEGGFVTRAFVPHAQTLEARRMDGKSLGELTRRHDAGFFEGKVALQDYQPIMYRAANEGGEWDVAEPYSFGPVLGPIDDYYLGEGSHLRLFDKLGAHFMEFEGVEGTHFAVWAPNAKRVSVVGPFNDWDGRRHAMRSRLNTGVWEIFIPWIGPGTIYKFEILGATGKILPLKADPFGQQAELRPGNASIVADPTPFDWTDKDYLDARRERDKRRVPISVYEVHPGSWRRHEDGRMLSYDEMADQLIPYVREMGFTHIEFLPISEHPYDPSWGYQPIGLYAPTSRFGDPKGFARFVDAAHAADIGVILDWVPAHFPTDEHGLAWFDGTALYEHADPRRGFHPDWNTAIYNFGRREVRSFLVNNALFWLEKFHIDGLRVDAVASMLYLDYSRKQGEWVANEKGGNENLEAIEFLQAFNKEVYALHPGTFTVAEESTSWPGVSKPVHEGGLGFGFKWNMGFMHDTLDYLKRDPVHRRFHHNNMTFGLIYAFSENFVLPLSHDEVVHGKGSLLNKMSGDDWQQFANLRAYYGYMWGYPGKKLLFMGQEFAQRNEWNESRALDWWLMDAPAHAGVAHLIADLNRVYRDNPALHARDCEPDGFEWLMADDADQSVFAWLRKADGEKPVAVVVNMTPVARENFQVPAPKPGRWREILNTDSERYGGSNTGNQGVIEAKAEAGRGWPASFTMTLPPLATVYLEPEE